MLSRQPRQTDETEKPRRSRAITWLTIALVVAPFLYVLSIGPAIWLLDRGLISKRPFETVYFPLARLADKYPAFKSTIEWYADFWWQSE